MFLKEVYACQSFLCDQTYSKLVTVSYFNFYFILFFLVMADLNFQEPLLQSSVSYDPSEMFLMCKIIIGNISY